MIRNGARIELRKVILEREKREIQGVRNFEFCRNLHALHTNDPQISRQTRRDRKVRASPPAYRPPHRSIAEPLRESVERQAERRSRGEGGKARVFRFGFGVGPGDVLDYRENQLSPRVGKRKRPSPFGDVHPPVPTTFPVLAAVPRAQRETLASSGGASLAHHWERRKRSERSRRRKRRDKKG